MAHGGDVIEELTTDHREVEALFEQIQSMPSGIPDRKRSADELTIELVRHAVAEEEYLYPTVRKRIEGGERMADKEIADHTRVEEILKDLESRQFDDPAFDQLIIALHTEVSAHVRDEESRLFPMLRQACSDQMLMDLGDKIRRAKKLAPTRPHPGAPTTPPANKLLAPGVGLVDRARDFVTGRGKPA